MGHGEAWTDQFDDVAVRIADEEGFEPLGRATPGDGDAVVLAKGRLASDSMTFVVRAARFGLGIALAPGRQLTAP
jgi:DNA-binding transcriptional LysR family regulator